MDHDFASCVLFYSLCDFSCFFDMMFTNAILLDDVLKFYHDIEISEDNIMSRFHDLTAKCQTERSIEHHYALPGAPLIILRFFGLGSFHFELCNKMLLCETLKMPDVFSQHTSISTCIGLQICPSSWCKKLKAIWCTYVLFSVLVIGIWWCPVAIMIMKLIECCVSKVDDIVCKSNMLILSHFLSNMVAFCLNSCHHVFD